MQREGRRTIPRRASVAFRTSPAPSGPRSCCARWPSGGARSSSRSIPTRRSSPSAASRSPRARSSTWRCRACAARSASSRSIRSVSAEAPSLAASIAGACRYGRAVSPREMRPVDLVVCGSVAVGRDGARSARAAATATSSTALLREEGKVRESTPILTTVHALQIVDRPHRDAAARPPGRLPRDAERSSRRGRRIRGRAGSTGTCCGRSRSTRFRCCGSACGAGRGHAVAAPALSRLRSSGLRQVLACPAPPARHAIRTSPPDLSATWSR